MKNSIKAYFVLLSGIMLFATLNIHSRSKVFDYHSEIFADKAGYYMFLPAVFIYDFNPQLFPDSIDVKTGHGFKLTEDKIITKYPTGVSVLQSPFFFAVHFYEKINNDKADGFSVPYHKAIDVSAIFYLIAGLVFLYKFLLNYFNTKTIIISQLVLLFGTNLYYYATVESGLSHIYSFFLFCVFLYMYKLFIQKNSLKHFLILGVLLGFVFIVRPINIFLAMPLFFLDYKNLEEFVSRFRLKWWYYLIGLLLFLIVISPQIIYYLYLSNSVLFYSYGEESFIYKYSPKILKVLFAFENGWIINNPLHIITIAGVWYMFKVKANNAFIVLLTIVLVTVTYASWWSTQLGCGLGHRGYVEFYSLLILPLVYVIQYLSNTKSNLTKYFILFIIFVGIAINIKLVYTFDGCWFGESSWDYKEFSKLLFTPTK